MFSRTIRSTAVRNAAVPRLATFRITAFRTYADTGSTTYSEASQVNQSRGRERAGHSSEGGSVAQPVSETKQASQDDPASQSDNAKRPPEEPDHVKREQVLKEGDKKLDPADDGTSKSR